MRKLILGLVITLLLLPVIAIGMLIPANDKAKDNAVTPENSPVINETEAGEWDLERIDFIHYAKPANPGKPAKTETCYKLLGVKWKTLPVSYVINPTNPQNLTENFVTSAISTSAETWDAVTSTELFNNAYAINYTAQYGVQNYQNAIAFGDYPDNSVIAVTSVWYTPVGRRIVEFDILFNTRFTWGDANNPPTEEVCTEWIWNCTEWDYNQTCINLEQVCTKWETRTISVMDLQNIATHELGHGAGLDDIYSSTCSAVTMYGYSSYGETSKRTLEQPDITGLQKMYRA